MVDELIVECPHQQLGCKHSCQRQLLEVHLRDSCMYVQVACPEDGCDKTVLRKDLGKHTHDCLHRVLACDACGTAVRAYDLEVCVLGAGVPAIPQFSALTTWFVLFLQLGSLFGMHCEGCVLFGVWYIVEAG